MTNLTEVFQQAGGQAGSIVNNHPEWTGAERDDYYRMQLFRKLAEQHPADVENFRRCYWATYSLNAQVGV